MFANPQSFGMAVPSSGSLVVPCRASSNVAWGLLTADQIVCQEPHEPVVRIMSRSIGSVVIERVQEMIVTASAHTILDTLRLPVLIVDEMEELIQEASPDIMQIPDILGEIEALTGLPKVHIAEDIFGVTRTAYHDWSIGKRLFIDNERRIRGTLDVLKRASMRHPEPELMRGWLVTPVGSRAVSPAELLRAGKIDEARLLAVSSVPVRETALPEWLLNGPVNKWSERDQQRRNFVVRESDAIASASDED